MSGRSATRPRPGQQHRHRRIPGTTTDQRAHSELLDHPVCLYASSQAIATITLNRPAARNGFTLTMADELNTALRAADQDDEVRVVLIRAARPHFCVGMDMTGAPTVGDSADPSCDEPAARVARPIANLNKPVIAATQGAAVGVGISMLLPADFRLAADDALALDIASNVAPVSAAVIRRGLTTMMSRGNPEAAFAVDRHTIPYAFTTADLAEGVASFLEKRPPKFDGVARTVVHQFGWLEFDRH